MTHPWSPPPGGGRPDFRPPVPAQFAGPHHPPGSGQPWPGHPGGPPPVRLTPVPRPPKPVSVRVATTLTWVGFGLSGLATLAAMVYLWILGIGWVPSSSDERGSWNVVFIGFEVFVLISWLPLAVGSAKNAVRAGQGSDPARGWLTVLMVCNAMAQVFMIILGLFSWGVAESWSDIPEYARELTTVLQWGVLAGQIVCVLLAIAIVVLLLVPSASRYYLPGPGRYFVPNA